MYYYYITKRILDIIGALVGIVLFAPIMIITAIHIKRVSPEGPILADMPKRVGLNGKEFKMFKFRSMHPGAHEKMLADPELSRIYRENGYKLDAHLDPRLIPGGAFIRKTSIDELPQFFNILLGHMSIVGPRAYFPQELKEQSVNYPEAIPHIEKLKTIKPGLTGPWQVGGRNDLPFVERVKLDAEYAEKRSLIYDLKIIILTPVVVITGKGVK